MTDTNAATGSAPTAGGREIAFSVAGHPCRLSVEAPGDTSVPSVFLVGLPKAGSTLLNLIMQPLLKGAGLTYVNLPGALQELGVPPRDYPADLNQAFQPTGYAFGGFRSLPGAFALPAYAGDRTVLLVRDPRDMLTSLFFSIAYSHAPPGQGVGGGLARAFEENRDNARDLGIDAFVLDNAKTVAAQFARIERKLAAIRHKLYRYEDVVFDKLNWARDMLGYLGLAVEADRIERVVARQDIRPAEEDAGRHVRKVSPGDHLEKLRPETIAALNARLAPVLAQYGYA